MGQQQGKRIAKRCPSLSMRCMVSGMWLPIRLLDSLIDGYTQDITTATGASFVAENRVSHWTRSPLKCWVVATALLLARNKPQLSQCSYSTIVSWSGECQNRLWCWKVLWVYGWCTIQWMLMHHTTDADAPYNGCWCTIRWMLMHHMTPMHHNEPIHHTAPLHHMTDAPYDGHQKDSTTFLRMVKQGEAMMMTTMTTHNKDVTTGYWWDEMTVVQWHDKAIMTRRCQWWWGRWLQWWWWRWDDNNSVDEATAADVDDMMTTTIMTIWWQDKNDGNDDCDHQVTLMIARDHSEPMAMTMMVVIESWQQ